MKRGPILLTIGFVLGLVLRCAMLGHMGVTDMDAYYEWGRQALEKSLPRTYHGIYFPLQYQLFQFCAWVVAQSGVQFFTIFKLSNLPFDLGCFLLLILLLRRQGANPAWALLYWLHPFFLTVFSLGYIDFQFAFFVLLSLWLLRHRTNRDFLVAGLALGCAFVMKPQAQILIIAVAAYAFARYWRRREMSPFLMLAGPSVLFLAYELYFSMALHSRRSHFGETVLPLSYLNISNFMPVLTAYMTNIWYPVAYLLKPAGQPITAVSDQIEILPFLSIKYCAAIAVLTSIGFYARRVERMEVLSEGGRLSKLFCFSAMVVPFVMTSAHENHLFLGLVLLVLVAGKGSTVTVRLAGAILCTVQFVHLYSLYGTHPAGLATLFRPMQSDELAIVYSVISVACFAVIARSLWIRPKVTQV